ncbi:MAG TPA: DNA-directed RNA polymerase subunit omega [Acidisarcina sp.]
MRSDLIFGAEAHVKNRYQLCQLTALATRKLHRPTVRVQDTTNDVLDRFRKSDPAAPSAKTNTVEQNRAA